MKLRDFPKAEATVIVVLLLLLASMWHLMQVAERLLTSSADVPKIDAFGRLLDGQREALLWALGLAFGYVGVRRATSKPDVIRAEADAARNTGSADGAS
jgi:hypothetical protein